MPETAFYLMVAVWNMDGECTQADICELMSMSRQTVNSAAKALEKDGYLVLTLQSTGRKKTMTFTQKGKDFAAAHAAPSLQMDQQAWENISVEEGIMIQRGYNLHKNCAFQSIPTLYS